MEEKYTAKDGESPSSGSPPPTTTYVGESTLAKRSMKTRVWDSFQRDPNATVTRPGAVGADGKVFDVESAARATAESPLSRRLKGRHLQMIAIGGSIGTSPSEISSLSFNYLTLRIKVPACLLAPDVLWPLEGQRPSSSLLP